MGAVKHLVEDIGLGPVPLPNVSGQSLAKILEYANQKKADGDDVAHFKTWENQEFYPGMSNEQLFALIMAADYVAFKVLLDSACLRVANMIKGKTPTEIRSMFDIPDDFSPEEKAEIERENAWAFE